MTRLHNERGLDAYWMPFTANRAFKADPRLLVSASGTRYRADDGREVLDGISGLWCCNAGHGHPRIVEAIAHQVAELDYATAFQVGHPKVFALAERLADMAPQDIDAVFFTNSGSESVDTALKIALAYHHARGESERTRFVGRERGYHGAGFGGTSVGGIGNNRKHFGPLLPGVLHLPQTYDHEHQAFSRGQPEWGAHLADELERIVAVNHASTIAAVIVEPFAGSAGVLIPPIGYLERLREITAKHGILLIFDEVITAFGRLGAGFAAERFGVVPDLVTIAKGLTSGAVPMGAVLARGEIRKTIIDAAPDAIELFHGYTYSGHPVAAAAAHAALDVYRDEGVVRAIPYARTGPRRRAARPARQAPCARYPQHRPGGRGGVGAAPGRTGGEGHRGIRPSFRPRHPGEDHGGHHRLGAAAHRRGGRDRNAGRGARRRTRRPGLTRNGATASHPFG